MKAALPLPRNQSLPRLRIMNLRKSGKPRLAVGEGWGEGYGLSFGLPPHPALRADLSPWER